MPPNLLAELHEREQAPVPQPSAIARLLAALPNLPRPEAPTRIAGSAYARELDHLAKSFPGIDALALNEATNQTYGGERVARLRITTTPKDFIGRDTRHVEVNARVLADVIAAGLKAMGRRP